MSKVLPLPAPAPRPAMTPPKGRPRTAQEVVERWFTDESGVPFRTRDWVLRNVRPRHKLGRSCVVFYDVDVEEYIASTREEV